MPGPGPDVIDHYVRTFERFRELSPFLGEALCWTVIRGHDGQLTVDEVVRRLGGDPATIRLVRPLDDDLEDVVLLEQRGDAVLVVEQNQLAAGDETVLPRLSRDATVHGTGWLVNAYSSLYYATNGVVITELSPLRPQHRYGADPEALNDHLGALLELARRQELPDPGPFHDWPTAMATVESLTGERLTADWFERPHQLARVSGG